MVTLDESGFLSDESDFYGDEAVKRDLEHRAEIFSTVDWWEKKILFPTEIANSNTGLTKEEKPVTQHNPYEGKLCGRQLNETVEEFLQRIPPSTTATTEGPEGIPWIFVANPYIKPPKADPEYKQYELPNEGPPDEESDWAQYVIRGGILLKELTSIMHEIERTKSRQVKATITKAINIQKEMVVQKLMDTAVELHCVSGKWMIFCESTEVDATWSVVARATASNELGIAAKVSPRGNDDRQPRLICVYTKNFTDMKDVSRVARKMSDLGLISTKGKPIYYKCDAYTYLGLSSGNEYNIRASLYNSEDVLKLRNSNIKSQKVG